MSETIRVISIVGRFLEHARVYYFQNGGAEEYFIGSADAMRRNLEDRVEVMVPVEDPALQRGAAADARDPAGRPGQRLGHAAATAPTASAGRLPAQEALGSHQQLIEYARKKQKESLRYRRKKSRGGKKRNLL